MKKIRFRPNVYQKKILDKWFGVTRFIYNFTLNKIKNKEVPINFMKIRNKLITAKGNKIPKWQLEIPKEVRAYSVNELVTNYKTNLNNKKKFTIKFKSKKNPKSVITIPKQAVKINGYNICIYKRFNLGNFKLKEKVDIVEHDIKIMKIKPNIWYLLIPKTIKCEKRKLKKKICSLDPGYRTFITGVDLNGNCFKIGETAYEKIKILQNKIDNLKSRLDSVKYDPDRVVYLKTKNRLQRKYFKLDNIVDDLHNKTIKYLTSEFDIIILPKFETKKLIKHKANKFNRMIMALKHYKFKLKLENKCKLLNKRLIITNESYTSKTCCNCGHIDRDLGSSKIYNCKICKLSIDRDINGAINILQKTLVNY